MYGAAQENTYGASYAQNYGSGASAPVANPQQGGPQMGGQPMGGPPMAASSFGPQMGGPPMGMGQPMMDPQAMAAQEALGKIEEKKRKKEEHDKEKEEKHYAHLERTGNRQQAHNESCANILIFWGLLNGLLWALPLLGGQWWTKRWSGQGIDKLELTAGLFSMQVDLQCAEAYDNGVCHAMEDYAKHDGGHWAMAELSGEMCSHIKASCFDARRLMIAGWIPTCLLPVSASFEVIAIFLLYYYWHSKPTASTRSLMNKLALLAPFLGAFAFVGWMIVSPGMQQLPRYWAKQAGQDQFANSYLFGLTEAFIVPAGWCCLCCFGALGSSCLRFFCQYTMAAHFDEPYGDDESQQLMKKTEKMHDAEAC